MMRRSLGFNIMIGVAVTVLVVVTLAPLLWLFIMSISAPVELTRIPLHWLPDRPDFSRYARLFGLTGDAAGTSFLAALRNSLVVSFSATAIALAAGIPAAYSFSRFRGRMGLLYGFLGVYMVPPVAFVLPLYMVFSQLGLLNNVVALIAVYCTILLPFSTWLLKNNFDEVPREVEEAAQMDGAGLLGAIRHVTLPLARPALAAAALFALLLAWDEFFYALIYTNDLRAQTLPVAIADFAAGRATDYGLISAVGVLAALPPVIIAFFLQRSLVSGLSAGGIKG